EHPAPDARRRRRRLTAARGSGHTGSPMKISTALTLIALVACAGCGGSEAPNGAPPGLDVPAPPGELGGVFEAVRQDAALPAVPGAVWRGDRLLASGVAGVRRYGVPTAAALDDQWHLGSDTKAMTATLIGLYVDRGRIRFEDTVGALFAGETVDPGWADVTI